MCPARVRVGRNLMEDYWLLSEEDQCKLYNRLPLYLGGASSHEDTMWKFIRTNVARAFMLLMINGNSKATENDRDEIGALLKMCDISLDYTDAITLSCITAHPMAEHRLRKADLIRQRLIARRLPALHSSDVSLCYKNDFYHISNFVAYTGEISDYPTLYFRSDTEVGKITQRHHHPNNLGRERVTKAVLEDYIVSTGKNGEMLEYIFDSLGALKIFHPSRTFCKNISGDMLLPGSQYEQAVNLALRRYPYLKENKELKVSLHRKLEEWYVK